MSRTAPLMLQDWTSVTFLHWRYYPLVIQSLLPAGLEVDLFDGSAWVGLVPFRVANLRPPGIPALPWISHFPETNVRTYVKGPGGKPAIWFFTLEAARLAAVIGARASFGLPYRWARMRLSVSGSVAEYTSRRRPPWSPACSHIRMRIGEPIAAGPLETFLTARFRLYARLCGRLAFSDVEHEPWPLQRARVLSLEQDLMEHSGLEKPSEEPHALYSPGVRARVWRPHFTAAAG